MKEMENKKEGKCMSDDEEVLSESTPVSKRSEALDYFDNFVKLH